MLFWQAQPLDLGSGTYLCHRSGFEQYPPNNFQFHFLVECFQFLRVIKCNVLFLIKEKSFIKITDIFSRPNKALMATLEFLLRCNFYIILKLNKIINKEYTWIQVSYYLLHFVYVVRC